MARLGDHRSRWAVTFQERDEEMYREEMAVIEGLLVRYGCVPATPSIETMDPASGGDWIPLVVRDERSARQEWLELEREARRREKWVREDFEPEWETVERKKRRQDIQRENVNFNKAREAARKVREAFNDKWGRHREWLREHKDSPLYMIYVRENNYWIDRYPGHIDERFRL